MKSLRFMLLASGCLYAYSASAGGDAVSATNVKIDAGGVQPKVILSGAAPVA